MRSGFEPHYCLEDTSWLDEKPVELAYPMVCFCDIPLARIANHTSDYGSYGIGLTKEWAIKTGLTPVSYAAPNSVAIVIPRYLRELYFSDAYQHLNAQTNNELFYKSMAFTKPLSGKSKPDNEIKNFNQENEWRFVPRDFTPLDIHTFQVLKNQYPIQNIQFDAKDIKYIFVKSDADINLLWDFIHAKLEKFSEEERKILTTKIISLETLMQDI